MDITKVSLQELLNIINHTKNLELLELAEEEYIRRTNKNIEESPDSDEEMEAYIKAHFRAN